MTRAAALVAAILAVWMVAGCEMATAPEEFDLVRPAREAADVARARARVLADEMDLLRRERAELSDRRKQLLKDAEAYRRSAADVWSEPGLSDLERRSYAKQYTALAEERENQAQRCAELMKVYEARIGALEGERRDQISRAQRFESVVLPEP